MSDLNYRKALFKAWEKDEEQAVIQARVDTAYELGFHAAWHIKANAEAAQPVDTGEVDLVELIARGLNKHEQITDWSSQPENIRNSFRGSADACLTALQSAGYKITRAL